MKFNQTRLNYGYILRLNSRMYAQNICVHVNCRVIFIYSNFFTILNMVYSLASNTLHLLNNKNCWNNSIYTAYNSNRRAPNHHSYCILKKLVY